MCRFNNEPAEAEAVTDEQTEPLKHWSTRVISDMWILPLLIRLCTLTVIS
ncbi:hypothetical protein ES702_03035 [subsurface metagenome]